MSPEAFLRSILSLEQGCGHFPGVSVERTQRLSHGNKRSMANSSQEGTEAALGSQERRGEQGRKEHLLICTGWKNGHRLVSAAEEQGWWERHGVHQEHC